MTWLYKLKTIYNSAWNKFSPVSGENVFITKAEGWTSTAACWLNRAVTGMHSPFPGLWKWGLLVWEAQGDLYYPCGLAPSLCPAQLSGSYLWYNVQEVSEIVINESDFTGTGLCKNCTCVKACFAETYLHLLHSHIELWICNFKQMKKFIMFLSNIILNSKHDRTLLCPHWHLDKHQDLSRALLKDWSICCTGWCLQDKEALQASTLLSCLTSHQKKGSKSAKF